MGIAFIFIILMVYLICFLYFRASHLADVHYNASHFTKKTVTQEFDVGPPVIHVYTITNNGPSGIEEAEIFLIWPYATLAGNVDIFRQILTEKL